MSDMYVETDTRFMIYLQLLFNTHDSRRAEYGVPAVRPATGRLPGGWRVFPTLQHITSHVGASRHALGVYKCCL
jgi:hypothetical protein